MILRGRSIKRQILEDFVRDVGKIERRSAARLKFKDVERLRSACDAACSAHRLALGNMDEVHVKYCQMIDDAMSVVHEKGDASGSLQGQISELETTAREDLLTTADPAWQAEIDQIEARLRDIRREQESVGRAYGCDAATAVKYHHEFNAESARLQERVQALRVQQLS